MPDSWYPDTGILKALYLSIAACEQSISTLLFQMLHRITLCIIGPWCQPAVQYKSAKNHCTILVSFPFKGSIYPVVFRYQEQKPAKFAGFLLFWYDFAHFYTENVPIFWAYFRAFLNERKRYLSAFRNCSPNCSIFLSFYIHILDILASEIGFSLRFLKPFSLFKKFVGFAALIRNDYSYMTAHFSPIYRTLSVLLHSGVNVL